MIFLTNKQIMNYFFVFADMLLISVIAFLQYSQISYYSKEIINTSSEVDILDKYIILKTLPFKVFLWVNKPSRELKFRIDEVKIRKVSYPLKQIHDLDGTLKLIDNEKVAYIIVDYFDKELEEKILEIY